MNENPSRRRFVVLRHTVGPGLGRTAKDHLDWMFEQDDETLQTWETPLTVSFDNTMTLATQRLNDHRIDYLDLQGSLGEGRGEVTQVISGEYQIITIGKRLICFRVGWREAGLSKAAQLEFYQKNAKKLARDVQDESWYLRILPLRQDTK